MNIYYDYLSIKINKLVNKFYKNEKMKYPALVKVKNNKFISFDNV